MLECIIYVYIEVIFLRFFLVLLFCDRRYKGSLFKGFEVKLVCLSLVIGKGGLFYFFVVNLVFYILRKNINF